jgi:hypothetical protein
VSVPTVAALSAEIANFIDGAGGDEAFDYLAQRLFAYQYHHNAPYHRFCVGRGVLPEAVRAWRDIPPAPAAAFKHFALTCASEEDCIPERGGRVFHSSGTTGAEMSRHFMDAAALDAYRVSLRAGYRRFVPEGSAGIFALMPSPEEAPHSSLSFMLSELDAVFIWGDHWIEKLALQFRAQRKPCTVFGTAFAWIHFFDTVSERFHLPAGSVILETGGFKGRSREVPREGLYALFNERLGVPLTHCVSEYGMSEMASQFYDSTLYDHANGVQRNPRKVAAATVRTRILDPVTNEDAPPGQPGLLLHYDIANLNSVLAILTEDMGVAAEDGDGFHLLGRAPGAVLRGCSLTAEEMMNARAVPSMP